VKRRSFLGGLAALLAAPTLSFDLSLEQEDIDESLCLESMDALLKEYYSPQRIRAIVYQDVPFLSLVPRSVS